MTCYNCLKSFDVKVCSGNICPDCYKKMKSEIVGNDVVEITKTLKKEEVNHPERYGGDTTYECIKVLKAWVSPEEYKGFLRCNAIKYLCRVGKKDESVQELKKASWYLDKLIEFESNDNNEKIS